MAYPTKPDGCLLRSEFVFNVADSSWETTGIPDKQYAYAILEISHAPTIWQTHERDVPRRISVSRALAVDAGQGFADAWFWIQPFSGDRRPLLDKVYDSEELGWQAYQDQSVYADNNEPHSVTNKSFAIIEIVMWGAVETRDLAQIAAVSVDIINDSDYDDPGASAIRQHVERMNMATIAPGEFASAYHAMWGLSESLNRSMYEDRNHNTWPIWGDSSPPE